MTYTRVQAAEICGVSNRSISNWLKEFESAHGLDGILEGDRITDFGLERLRERAELGAAGYREKYAIISAPADLEAIPASSVTLADRCVEIAANVGTVEVMSSEPYEKRASAAKSALSQFIATNNARASQLASNAIATRRSFEQLGQEHAIGHLMTYAESMNKTLAEGMAAMQNGAVNTVDRMGNAAAADIAS